MKDLMTQMRLRRERESHARSGGRSEGNRHLGFRPAFLDVRTMQVHESRFSNGQPAPIHVLDGLPPELIVDRTASGRVVAAKATLMAGFVRNGFFYTRASAARAAREWR